MKDGRFNTSKCRGKLQKMGVMYTHFSKSHGPFPKLPKKKIKKIRNSLHRVRRWPVAGG
jgi:hypothetical protein